MRPWHRSPSTQGDGDGHGVTRPGLLSAVYFVVLVLALASLQGLPALVDSLGGRSPEWLASLTLLVGGGLSPLWALLIVGGLTLRGSRLRVLVRNSLRCRVDRRLYVAALLLPFAVMGMAAMLSGTPFSGLDGDPLMLVGQVLLLAPLFALAEQLGWRTWLQQGLQERFSGWVAGMLVGIVWAVFHWPLFLSGSPSVHANLPFASFVVLTTAVSVVLAGLFNAARGSVVPVVVGHVAWNVSVQLWLPPTVPETRLLFLVSAVLFAAAAFGFAAWSRTKSNTEPPAGRSSGDRWSGPVL